MRGKRFREVLPFKKDSYDIKKDLYGRIRRLRLILYY